MPTDPMPVTALAVLILLASGVGIIGAIFTSALLVAVYRERKDIKRAKAIAKANREIKARQDRLRRQKEREAKESADGDKFFKQWKVFVDGL